MGPAGLQLRPPGLMSLPPLEPLLPQALKDFKTQMPPPNFDNGPFRHPKEQEIIRINDDFEEGQQRKDHEGHPQNLPLPPSLQRGPPPSGPRDLPDEESSRDKSENDQNGSEASREY